jgi:hypothetical protein
MNTNLRTTEQHQTTSSEPTLHSTRRRNGKVASLPKPHRDLVNHMLEDGVAYKEIVAALAQLGHTVSARNISNWYQGGHQDWLLQQERLAANRIREEAVLDILTNDHDVDLPAAGLQIAATHLFQLLLACHPETADSDSGLNNYIRVANSLCRISRQLMKVQEFRDQYPADPDDPNNLEDPDHLEQAETESLPSADPELQNSTSNAQADLPSVLEVQSSRSKVSLPLDARMNLRTPFQPINPPIPVPGL